ncbi:unnamed protein product [Blepharisma stoltei]|uniref:Uncharacterized protein n=1 Tax=Blepharisma stoltei TaxID=1481888 RepID=A0AAU9IYF8_9CILI|nr:unnamed protein product [Blepharisma stoltei]
MDQELLFRVIIVGDTGVGKSCLLLRFSENMFKETHTVTIGVEFGTKSIEIKGQPIKIQIWDTAGQESFRSVTRSFYRRADGVLLVYDTTARHTFESCEYWLNEIRQNSSQDADIFLVANQVDLVENGEQPREVSAEDGKEFAEKHELSGFLETSAKSGQNVQEVFTKFCTILYEKWLEKQDDDPKPVQHTIGLKPTTVKKKKKCCGNK